MGEAVANRSPYDKDDAVAMVGEVRHTIDPVVEARAVRKIDLFLIPAMMCGCQFFSPILTPITRLRLLSTRKGTRWSYTDTMLRL